MPDNVNNIKKFFTKLVKSQKPIKIDNFNVNDVSKFNKREELNRQKKFEEKLKRQDILKGAQMKIQQTVSSFKERGLEKVRQGGEAIKGVTEKTTKTGFDILTSAGPLGQTLGLVTETLKDLGIPEMFGKVKDVFSFGDKKPPKVSIIDDDAKEKMNIERDLNLEINKIKNDINEIVRIIKEQLVIDQKSVRDKKISDRSFKADKRKSIFRDRQSQKAKIKSDKKQNRMFSLFGRKQKPKKVKVKRPKKEFTFKQALKMGAATVGFGLLAKDIIGSIGTFKKGDIGGGIMEVLGGKMPNYWKYKRDEEGNVIEKTPTGETLGKGIMNVLGTAGKFGALGYLVGGEQGALIGMLAGAIFAGFRLVWKKWLEPVFYEDIIPFFKKLGPVLDNLIDFLSMKPSFIKNETEEEKRKRKELERNKKQEQYFKKLYSGKVADPYSTIQGMKGYFSEGRTGEELLKKALTSPGKRDEQEIIKSYVDKINYEMKRLNITDENVKNEIREVVMKDLDNSIKKLTEEITKEMKESKNVDYGKLKGSSKEKLQQKTEILEEKYKYMSSDLEELLYLKNQLLLQ